MKSLLCIFGVCLFLCGCQGYTYQQDNVVEEAVEEVIRYHTGSEVDLSPSSPETGFSPKSIKPFVKDQ